MILAMVLGYTLGSLLPQMGSLEKPNEEIIEGLSIAPWMGPPLVPKHAIEHYPVQKEFDDSMKELSI